MSKFSPGMQFARARHGSLHDRGRADAYYGRGADPHYWPEGTGVGLKVTKLTKAEIAEYMHGYDNEHDRKDYGFDY